MKCILLLAAMAVCVNLAAFAAAPAAPEHPGGAQSVYIEDLTWPEVKAAIAGGKTTPIIYAGSTEQNGPHMARGEHNFIAHYEAGEIAKKLGNALVYPTMPFAPIARYFLTYRLRACTPAAAFTSLEGSRRCTVTHRIAGLGCAAVASRHKSRKLLRAGFGTPQGNASTDECVASRRQGTTP